MSKEFVSQFSGTCEDCNEPIVPGQKINPVSIPGRKHRAWEHVNCPPRRTVCPTCHLLQPCECE